MQGLRKILRALAIVLLPMVGTLIIYGSSSGLETAMGLVLILLLSVSSQHGFGSPGGWLVCSLMCDKVCCSSNSDR